MGNREGHLYDGNDRTNVALPAADNCPQCIQQNHYIPPRKTVITYENQETALTQPVKIASIKSSQNENVSGNDVNPFSSGQARQEEEP